MNHIEDEQIRSQLEHFKNHLKCNAYMYFFSFTKLLHSQPGKLDKMILKTLLNGAHNNVKILKIWVEFKFSKRKKISPNCI